MRGKDGARELYDIWTDAFPDDRVDVHLEIVEGPNGLQESHFRGTHTGTMRTPAGDIPATGKPVDIPLVGLMTVEDGRMAAALRAAFRGLIARGLKASARHARRTQRVG